MTKRTTPGAWQHLMDRQGFKSMRSLGDAAGISHTAVTRIIHGESKDVRDETVSALARALNADMETIYELVGKPVNHAAPWSPPAEAQRLTRRQRKAVEEVIRAMLDNTNDSWADKGATIHELHPERRAAPMAADDNDGLSEGQSQHARIDTAGEESQDPGGDHE